MSGGLRRAGLSFFDDLFSTHLSKCIVYSLRKRFFADSTEDRNDKMDLLYSRDNCKSVGGSFITLLEIRYRSTPC